MTDVIEKMARAMALANNEYDGPTLCWGAYEDDARAAYNAMMQHFAETGQVIVPLEPTPPH